MKPVVRRQLIPVMGGNWETWHQEAPPAAQVALDAALEALAFAPDNPGAAWAAGAVGPQSRPPLLWIPGHMEPDISWELLASCQGDVLKTGKRKYALGMMWVQVEGGKGWLGASKDRGHPVFHPQGPNNARKISISPFWLAQTPVTNAQMKTLCELSRSGVVAKTFKWSRPDYPAVWMNLPELDVLFHGLMEHQGLTLRLPTADEWEWAARGPDGRRYPWGDDPLDPERAWYGQEAGAMCIEVKRHPRGCGPWGSYDMIGNVFEWCGDGVLMGGCWRSSPEMLNSWDRLQAFPQTHMEDRGFRPVLDLL